MRLRASAYESVARVRGGIGRWPPRRLVNLIDRTQYLWSNRDQQTPGTEGGCAHYHSAPTLAAITVADNQKCLTKDVNQFGGGFASAKIATDPRRLIVRACSTSDSDSARCSTVSRSLDVARNSLGLFNFDGRAFTLRSLPLVPRHG